MAVQVKLTAVKPLTNSSTSSVVELSNFNFQQLVSAIREFLTSIQYSQGESNVEVDINTVATDWVTVRNGLKVYGAQLQTGNYPTVIQLHPSGSVTASNFIAEDVTDTLRLRLRVYGALPATGIPGELVYIEAQGTRVEGIYCWFTSTGWTLLAGAGYGASPCLQEVIMESIANTTTADGDLISTSLFLVPAPLPSSNFLLYVNGLQTRISDGTKLGAAYFSKNGGVTASFIREVDSSDLLYWNQTVCGYSLETYDTITLHYFTVDPFCSQIGYACLTEIATDGTLNFYQFGVQIIGSPATVGPITICRTPNPTIAGGYPLPDGYSFSDTIFSFTISDPNGIFPTGAIVRFSVPGPISEDDFNLIRVFHEVSGILIDETVLTGQYAPDYANLWIYAQCNEFSPFYMIQGTGISYQTTTTTTVLDDPISCPDNEISYTIESNKNPTQVRFFGEPAGPHTLIFTDQLGGIHDITGLLGDLITFPWTFDISTEVFSEIPTVIGVYQYTYSENCSYEIEVPISAISTTSTSTTTTSTSTTTTSTSTTTTTTVAEPMMRMMVPSPMENTSTITTTLEPDKSENKEINFLIAYGVYPSKILFYGTVDSISSIVLNQTDSYDLLALLGEQVTLPWEFNIESPQFKGISSVIGTYLFIDSQGCEYEIDVPIESVGQSSLTTTTTSTTTKAPTTTTTTNKPISSTTTTTTIKETTTTTTTKKEPLLNDISFSMESGKNPTKVIFFGTPIGPYLVEFIDMLGTKHDITDLTESMISLPWTFDLSNEKYDEISTVIGTYKFINHEGNSCEIEIPISAINLESTTTTTTTTKPTTTTTVNPTTTTTTTKAPTTTTTTTTRLITTTTTQPFINYVISNVNTVNFYGSPIGPYDVKFIDLTDTVFDLSELAGKKILPLTHSKLLAEYVEAGITSISGTYEFSMNGIVMHIIKISV